ncbi:MAG: hypothetical protein WBN10_08270, partial [Polyangiales bacterium]
MAWVALAGLVPTSASAQPAPGETAIDDADEAVEADAFKESPADLDQAQAAIEAAERQLEEAKRQMQLMCRKLAPTPEPIPGVGPGFVSADG